jgi:hypothetical protein
MRCDRLIQVRAPDALAKALTTAADKRLTSRSDYIRGALIDRLKADEIDLAIWSIVSTKAKPPPGGSHTAGV